MDRDKSIAKLIKLTPMGNLLWAILPPDTPNVESVAYEASYAGKRLRIHEQPETQFRNRRIVLELVDENGRELWEFPQSGALDDLWSTVRYEAAGVRQLLDELLAV
jgi:hypothetical protein